jgi:retron-type reverse transcriptase
VAQRWLLDAVLAQLPVHDAAMAFRARRSIVENAVRHTAQAIVVKIDLQDFFPSIKFHRVKGLFESFGYNEGVSTILTLLATEAPRVAATLDGERRFVAVSTGATTSLQPRQLPQGACTSPALTNIICRTLDRRLSGLAQRYGFAYSRYADDLAFSHPRADASVGALLSLARQIIGEEGFAVNEAKTRVMRPHQRQVVTGLVVNQRRPRVSRDDLRRFRAFLHHYETDGAEAVSERLGKDASAYAAGYLAFIHMVRPEHAHRLRRAHQWLRGRSHPDA